MSLVIDVPADIVKLLLTPIDPEQPAGHFDVEDETYQAIDQEMVKLGGLREGDIDWPYIDEASRQYLATQCKHWRILGHLQVVWLRTRQWARWADALGLIAGMVELYWDSAHPKPGPTGYLNKRKQVQRLLGDLGQVLPTLERSSFEPAYQAAAELALANLQRCAQSAKLDPEPLDALQRQLNKYSEPVVATEPARATTSGTALESAFFTRPKPQAPSNEREQRHAVLSMAEQVNQQDPYDPTGYQLRRFGLWSHLRTAPLITRDRRTELTAVPRDIVDGYQDALNHNAIEPNLLLRIEKSVCASPYWLRGSYLAAQVASRLAMEEVAAAIRQTCERFVCRLPALLELCFSDGTPFVDAQTQAWITCADQAQTTGSPVQEYAGLRDELTTQLNTEGVEVVLLRLQELHATHDAPRQRSYATVIAADLLASRGLSWLADDLYANVARLMRETTAQGWEPELYQRVAILDSERKD
ncbi:type VI secretion system protein TssA [Pseudomonas tolaasii]|uniref:Type VI secretion system protein TssA n=3 Tax=Pseudomonas tolaasii TaxID=29442 RepID=A0A7Y8AST3_PSETO|nr:type VI secretion system protein TssA [Pseudomonas tolaasii]ARB26709.1 type VI secretion-associated protein [Pseudomonas tolaasii]KAB0467523.1 type VI secretion system protein TssA [Pseudomonas tolaasii]MBY8943267.1 type VI secretion system protein TssA [Pseudomonas tolaasii]NWC24775.1 type VI secretion system protein TssA [Pseudomonas tolaasii]NWC43358.1 type VI secretion system protein TssA [Pseudomonas tolaasii]